MSRISLSTLPLLLGAGFAQAEAPRVTADIAPVHSLVATVMAGAGAPDLLVSPGASPHDYALRPSQAAALQDADIAFWTSEGLTPWLETAIEALAQKAGAAAVELIDAPTTATLPFREGALFEAHEHDDEDVHHDHDDHAHEGLDPHAWLSPENARAWLDLIAETLAARDPENAALYRANAKAGKAEIDAAITEINARLEPARGKSFIVFHDAYQYFETSFALPAAGAISVSDATKPSPARLREIEARIAEAGVSCVLTEPQFSPALVDALTRSGALNIGELDPLGAHLEPGPALYPQLIRDMGAALADCLGS